MGLLDDIRGLLTPKPAVVPNPFDRQANAAIPIMGASEILPNMVGRMTGSPIAEFAAGFLSPSSWIKQPKKLDIFVGKKGIKNLGLDDVLEKARQMEKAGKSRDEIQRTGDGRKHKNACHHPYPVALNRDGQGDQCEANE